MKLLLVRHGIAEDYGPDGTDESRRLTERGRKELEQVSREIAQQLSGVTQVCSSPLVRAAQTAEYLVHAFRVEGELDRLSQLIPEADPEEFHDWLLTRDPDAFIVAVGHQPNLGMLIRLLAPASVALMIEPKKASATLLELTEGPRLRGEVVWYKTVEELVAGR